MKPPYPCPDCQKGQMFSLVEDYRVRTSDGNVIVVPDVELHRCDACHQTIVPRESGKRIQELKAAGTEQFSPEELHAIFERADMTQKDFAEALGLGEKTFHRWLKGTQTVSRSMGYYLRAMDQFPQAFEWVKERRWRKPAPSAPSRPTQPVEARFPALHRRTSSSSTTRMTVTALKSNPAKALMLEAVHHTSH